MCQMQYEALKVHKLICSNNTEPRALSIDINNVIYKYWDESNTSKIIHQVPHWQASINEDYGMRK